MRITRVLALAVILALGAGTLAVPGAAAEASCSTEARAGGDWPSLNGSLDNARNQTQETTIGVTNAARLVKAWSFRPEVAGIGSFHSTPVIAEGCVFLTTSAGYALALNADTGALVWMNRYEETVKGVCCGGTMFAPTVVNGVVYINVSHNPTTATDTKGPYVLALDAHSGDVLWRSPQVAWEEGAYTNSSAVFIDNGGDGMILIGISNPEQTENQTGGFALVDASPACSESSADVCTSPTEGGTGGQVIKRTRTISDAQYAAGMGGGSIWSTAAVDDDLYAYAGTGQPSCWECGESEFVNAIIKFDVNPERETFGDIVDVRKGHWDSEVRMDQLYYIDVDFAASPTLYRDKLGQQMVAELQKSGWVHAAWTKQMAAAWSAPVSPYGWALGNYASTATDGKGAIFAHGTYPGQLFSLNGSTGLPNWVAPAPTLIGANPVTYANGVVWLASGFGILSGYDAATGAIVFARPMQLDAGDACTNAGAGVAIARNTLYTACGDGAGSLGLNNEGAAGTVIAYRLP